MIGAVVALDVVPRRVVLERVVQMGQVAQIVIAGLAGGLEGAAAFEQRHHRKQRVGVVFGELDDAAAAVRHQLYQALGGQHLERLAQGGAADLPGVGQRLLVDPGAGAELAIEDHGAQARRHAVVHRGAAQRDGVGHGSRSGLSAL